MQQGSQQPLQHFGAQVKIYGKYNNAATLRQRFYLTTDI
jgi:hypothetical protein